MEKKKHHLRFTVVMSVTMAVILAILIVANVLLLSVYPVSINNLLSVTDTPDGMSISSTSTDWKALCETIEGEGAVLLRNENNTLPINTGNGAVKVNLLGERAYNPVYGGTGSGSGDSSSAITLPDALNQNGFEVNPALENSGIYASKSTDDGSSIGWGDSTLE